MNSEHILDTEDDWGISKERSKELDKNRTLANQRK
jgi:hypothetical protein